MRASITRRGFLAGSLASSAVWSSSGANVASDRPSVDPPKPGSAGALPRGRIGSLSVSRLLLGGNLLTHYTHSRDLKYVYALAAQYNTRQKILETLALAETHGINTLVIHTVPWALEILKAHRQRGGRMQWIICTTAPVNEKMEAYRRSVAELVEMGTDAIYLWGVHADGLAAQGKVDLIAQAVEIARRAGVPSGVGAHDINVVIQCEQAQVKPDFYIKTLHHHDYPTAPRPDEIKGATAEVPGYWCSDPQMVVEVMREVTCPWLAFKVMAAGAIPPDSAFRYAFANGADHVLAGMFDFEIAEDVATARRILSEVTRRPRPWRS